MDVELNVSAVITSICIWIMFMGHTLRSCLPFDKHHAMMIMRGVRPDKRVVTTIIILQYYYSSIMKLQIASAQSIRICDPFLE